VASALDLGGGDKHLPVVVGALLGHQRHPPPHAQHVAQLV